MRVHAAGNRRQPTRYAFRACVAAGCAATLASVAMGGETGSWNCSADFSGSANPAGDWSYGQTPLRAGPFGLLPHPVNFNGAPFWTLAGFVPLVGTNTTGAPIGFADNVVIPPGVMMFHPGFGNVDAVVRWTSPIAGSALIVSDFGGVIIDPDASAVDVAILHNGTELFNADLVGPGSAAHDQRSLVVAAGDTLDFHVGQGVNGTIFNDSTAINITITVGCAADFNSDGFVDPDDLSDFITCFFLDGQFPGTCPAADFNTDGFRNPDDLADFITAFFLGCP